MRDARSPLRFARPSAMQPAVKLEDCSGITRMIRSKIRELEKQTRSHAAPSRGRTP